MTNTIEHKQQVARRLYQDADGKRWQVAYIAYNTDRRVDRLKLADAIGRQEDTIDNLTHAYSLFAEMVRDAWKHGKSSESIRKIRRQFPYTRWSVIYKMWHVYEFELDEARDWLENFDGGNVAMTAEIDNKYGAPEWERRAYTVFKMAKKLRDDFGVPDGLQKAAVNFVEEFDKWSRK